MTSSNTYNFLPTNGELVLHAYDRIQVRLPELRQNHMRSGFRELNLAMVQFSNLQPNLWKVVLNTINLVQGTATYSIPPNVVMILDAYRSINTGTSNQTNIFMTPISRTEYATYATPQMQAPPNVYWFDRLISPTVTMFPVPDGSGPYVFNYYACLQMQDANLPGGQTPDIPYLWLDALVAELAYRLSRIYAPTIEAVRKTDAKEAWGIAAAQNTENVPLVLAPNLTSYYRR